MTDKEDSNVLFFKWKYFKDCVSKAFLEARLEESYFDVTLVCEDQHLPTHKVLISSCSRVLKMLVQQNTDHHPLLHLPVKFEDLSAILDFMYEGEVKIEETKLDSFLAAAQRLKVKGLHTSPTTSVSPLPNIENGNENNIQQISRSTISSVRPSPKFRSPKPIFKPSDGHCGSRSLASPPQHNGQKSEGSESVKISQQLAWVGEAKIQVRATLQLLRVAGTREPPFPCCYGNCAGENYCTCVILEKKEVLHRALSTYQELVREGRDRDLIKLQQEQELKTKNAAKIGLRQVIFVPLLNSPLTLLFYSFR